MKNICKKFIVWLFVLPCLFSVNLFSVNATAAESHGRLFIDNMKVYYGYYNYVMPKFSNKEYPISYDYDKYMISIDKNGKVTPRVDSGKTIVTAKTQYHTVRFEVTLGKLENVYDVPTHYTSIESFSEEFKKFECNERETVIFMGDSFMDRRYFITDFYTRFANKNAFVSGVSGSFAEQWYWFGQNYIDYNIKAVVMHVGINDISQGWAKERVAKSLKDMFEFYHYVNTDLQIYWWTVENRITPKRLSFWEETIYVNQEIKEFAKDKDWLTVLDSYTAFNLESGIPDGKYYRDALHPSSLGYDVMFKLVEDAGLAITNKRLS